MNTGLLNSGREFIRGGISPSCLEKKSILISQTNFSSVSVATVIQFPPSALTARKMAAHR